MADDSLSIYDEIEIEDMTFDPALQIYTFPCPCGDRFEIAIDDLRDGEEIAVCPSCSLMIRVIFDLVRLYSGSCPIAGLCEALRIAEVLTGIVAQADLPKADNASNATVAVQA
jgi:diphthamide biosynthesis protein 3